ncbi:MAG: hypothetical protein KDG49_10905, partial [Geminicoccaceae bacterium]|nr:hypothetical protein [Geminicoccaceae bacterium]
WVHSSFSWVRSSGNVASDAPTREKWRIWRDTGAANVAPDATFVITMSRYTRQPEDDVAFSATSRAVSRRLLARGVASC